MSYSKWEQRQMDTRSGEEQDRYMRKYRLAQPRKNEQPLVASDGSCLRWGADQDETCRPL